MCLTCVIAEIFTVKSQAVNTVSCVGYFVCFQLLELYNMKATTETGVGHIGPTECSLLISIQAKNIQLLLAFFLIQNMFIEVASHSSWFKVLLVLLPSEGRSFCKPCFSSNRLAEHSGAANTQNYCLLIAKDSGDFIALHIHELGTGALCQIFLVLPLLLFQRGMKEIFCKWHVLMGRASLLERYRLHV